MRAIAESPSPLISMSGLPRLSLFSLLTAARATDRVVEGKDRGEISTGNEQ